MMIKHSYISLNVPNDLTETQALEWYKIVRDTAPEGVCVSTEVGPKNKATRFYMENHGKDRKYVVVLARDLLGEEAYKIAQKLEGKLSDIDFEIDWSQPAELVGKNIALKEDTFKAVALEASKRAHNAWVAQKISEGWRFGQKTNNVDKTSPLCANWENLSEVYRKNEYRRMLGLLEVLNEMGMTVSNKV